LRTIIWLSIIVGIAMRPASSCTVNFEYLMGPKRAIDRSLINSMKVSYSIPMLESNCNEIIRLIPKREETSGSEGCLNGLGHLAVIHLGWIQDKKVQVDEIFLGCDGFKTGSFHIGKKHYQISLTDKIIGELKSLEMKMDSFNEDVIDSTFF
jgi:hypothetical protein